MVYFKTTPLTPKEVQITLGTLLDEYLGTYTYDNGFTRKAVSINKRDQNASATGLELILQPAPRQKNRYQVWGFFLIDRGGSTDAMYYAMEVVKLHTRHGGFSRIINQNYDLKEYLQSFNEIPVGEIYKIRQKLLCR